MSSGYSVTRLASSTAPAETMRFAWALMAHSNRLRASRGEVPEDLGQLGGRVVVEVQELVEARLEAGVAADKLSHRLGVPGDDDDGVVAVVFHQLQERCDGLGQSICLGRR